MRPPSTKVSILASCEHSDLSPSIVLLNRLSDIAYNSDMYSAMKVECERAFGLDATDPAFKAMRKMATSNVLVVGLQGLGAEIGTA